MAEAMTLKERFLTAVTNGKGDRVPCAPDENIFAMVDVCKTYGKY